MARRKERPYEAYDTEVDAAATDGTARTRDEITEDTWSTPHAIGAPSTGIGDRPHVEHGYNSSPYVHRFPRIFGREED